MKYCSQCGSKNSDESRFCVRCGAASAPAQPVMPMAQPLVERPRKKKKGQAGGIIAICASGLALIMLFAFVIGPMISGRSIFDNISFSDRVLSAGSVVVSPEKPIAKIGDITVDFGGSLAEEAELHVQTGTQASTDERFAGIDFYDFTLDGTDEFATSVQISLPNTAQENEAFYVAFYNDHSGVWEKLPFETKGNEVLFSTRHFSRFGLVKYHRDRYAGPLTPLVVNYDELRKALDGIEKNGLLERFLEEKGRIGSDELINTTLSLMNNTNSYVSFPVSYEAALGDAAALELSDKLTIVGGAITALKIVYQLQAGDTYTKVLQDNIFDLCELALGGAALAIPTSTLLPVAAVGVFCLGLGYNLVLVPGYRDDSLQYAYRAFHDYCMFPHIAYDKDRAKLLADGTGEETPWVALETYNTKKKSWEMAHKGYDLLKLRQGRTEKWEKALMDCYTLYQKNPKAMQERINALFDEYLDVYWSLNETEQLQFAKDYCGISAEDWRWPDVAETQQMKDAVKAELMRDLKPVLRDVQETIAEDIKQTLIRETDALVDYLNTEISFVIVDPEAKKEGFANTRVANDIIRIEPVTGANQSDWICEPGRYGKDIVFSCTLNNYLKEGCPDKVCFYKTEADMKAGKPYMTVPLTVEMPLTEIILGEQQGIPGDYSVVQQDAVILYQTAWQVEVSLMSQFKDITVQKDGTISAKAPAQTVSYDGVLGSMSLFRVDTRLGPAAMTGKIDLSTGRGSVTISGSGTAELNALGSDYRWSSDFSGEMSVAYSEGRLTFTSDDSNKAVHVSGSYTVDDGDQEAATDEMLIGKYVYQKKGNP